MNVTAKSHNQKKLLWPIAAIAIGALLSTNPFYAPHVSLEFGIGAWFADMALVLILSVHPIAARLGILLAGLFFAVPCFLRASPLFRGLLMCCMAFPFAMATLPLFIPPTADLRTRLAYFFSWMGMQEIKRCARSFDLASLLRLIAATMVFAAALAGVKAVTAVGLWLLARWLAGGIMIFAFAEMTTASHDFLTRLLGLTGPALMRSPFLSTSVGEFWARRWNLAASAMGFRPLLFMPFARRSIVLALFVAFSSSAVVHVLLAYMAISRWKISLVCGAFFLVQPLLILLERRMHVWSWQTTAARVWTLSALTITSPLFVEPGLQILMPSLGATDNLLPPTIAVLGFVMMVNAFFAMGQLVSCCSFTPPHPAMKLPV